MLWPQTFKNHFTLIIFCKILGADCILVDLGMLTLVDFRAISAEADDQQGEALNVPNGF